MFDAEVKHYREQEDLEGPKVRFTCLDAYKSKLPSCQTKKKHTVDIIRSPMPTLTEGCYRRAADQTLGSIAQSVMHWALDKVVSNKPGWVFFLDRRGVLTSGHTWVGNYVTRGLGVSYIC